MADYLPLHTPGNVFTRTVSADVVGGQLVRVSGTGTVAPAGAGAIDWLGVAAFDAKAGDLVTVWTEGVHRLKASGAIPAGSLVSAGANGTVAVGATPAAGANVGLALTTAADTALVEVKLVR